MPFKFRLHRTKGEAKNTAIEEKPPVISPITTNHAVVDDSFIRNDSNNQDEADTSLWARALENLKPEDLKSYKRLNEDRGKDTIDINSSKFSDEVRKMAEQKLQEFEMKSRTYTLNGEDKRWRDTMTDVLKSVNNFTPLANTVASSNPYAGIAWGGISFLISFGLSDSKAYDTVTEGIRTIARLITWSAEVERIYANVKSPLSKDLSLLIIQLYTCILQYEIKSFRYFEQSKAKNFVGAPAYLQSFDGLLSDMKNKKSEISDTTRLIFDEKLLNGVLQVEEKGRTSITRIELTQETKDYIKLFGNINDGYHKDLSASRVEGTCQWVLLQPQYEWWLCQRNTTLLWITGNLGCGKTIITSYIKETLDNTNKFSKSQALICSFFCSEEFGKQNSLTILRSIIFQIISRREDLIKHVKPIYKMYGNDVREHFYALWSILEAIINDEQSGLIYIIIDAIDECEEKTRNEFLEKVKGLIRKVKGRDAGITCYSPMVKFIITSQAHFKMTINGCGQRLKIEEQEDEINKDLRLFINHEVTEIFDDGDYQLESNLQTKQYLEQALNSKSDKTFLWVALVLQHIRETPNLSMNELQRIVDDLPEKLEEMYERFILRIPTKYQPDAIRLLKLIMGSRRPLTLNEIGIALDIRQSHQDYFALSSACRGNMRDIIQRALGPLARISEEKVHLVHQSVKKFLEDLTKRLDKTGSNMFGINPQDANLALAQSCVYYLQLADFSDSQELKDLTVPSEQFSDSEDEEGKTPSIDDDDNYYIDFEETLPFDLNLIGKEGYDRICAKYTFFDYAARFWAEHIKLCESIVPEELQNTSTGMYKDCSRDYPNWFHYSWITRETSLSYPNNFNTLTAASFFGHSRTLSSILAQRTACDDLNQSYSLYWASRRGHYNAIAMLLSADAGPSSSIEGKSDILCPVSQVDKQDQLDCSSSQVNIDINYKDNKGRTPLSVAAGNDHCDIVQLLLKDTNIQPNNADNTSWTPLFWAVIGNYHDTVATLCADKRVDVHHKDKRGRNVFVWACAEGMHEMTEFFIEGKRRLKIDYDSKDLKGRTALSLAAENGHYEVIKSLLAIKGLDVSAKDAIGRNAVSWASSAGRLDVLDELIRFDNKTRNVGIDEADAGGYTPLSWSLKEGYVAVVRRLVATKRVDVNRKDEQGRCPLSWAAGNGFHEIVEVLLQTNGIDVNSRDEEGWTPMFQAACSNRVDIIRLMLKVKGIDVNAKDNIGRTALSMAIVNNASDSVIALEHHCQK